MCIITHEYIHFVGMDWVIFVCYFTIDDNNDNSPNNYSRFTERDSKYEGMCTFIKEGNRINT